MNTHILKTDPDVFEATWLKTKAFEIRLNDRDFKVGDALVLRETKHSGEQMRQGRPLEYTGRTVGLRVLYVLEGPCYGLAKGWCVMSCEAVGFVIDDRGTGGYESLVGA